MLTTKPVIDTTDYMMKAQSLPLEMASYAARIWFAWMCAPWSKSGPSKPQQTRGALQPRRLYRPPGLQRADTQTKDAQTKTPDSFQNRGFISWGDIPGSNR